ncbi:hypothetical protein ABEB36_006978 [Hypothenemus hampei]|uniref:Calponin-homology (CH) domain-containing protein n=1 Tax=Hypothenemus hampei TaxID=57062 RepID=A0ABD1EWB6_HYPHA
MSFFFQVSPVHKRNKPRPKKLSEDESTTEFLSLAPFTPNPKIVFNNVVVGTVEIRKLQIKNPTEENVHLFIKKPLPADLNVVLNWSKLSIEQGGEAVLEICWSPSNQESSRHSFTLSDGKKINRDIGVVFKTLPTNEKTLRLKKKGKNPITLPLVPRSISPKKKMKMPQKSPSKPHSIRQMHIYPQLNFDLQQCLEHQRHNEMDNKNTENKENVHPKQLDITYLKSPVSAIRNDDIDNRRSTYSVKQQLETRKFNLLLGKENSPNFSDSLEGNLSSTPNSIPLINETATPTLESLLHSSARRVLAESYSRNYNEHTILLQSPNISSETYTIVTPKSSPRETLPFIESTWTLSENFETTSLTSIPEEESTSFETYNSIQIGSKRKNSILHTVPAKRERISVEPKGYGSHRIAKTTSGLNLKQFIAQDHSETLTVTETITKTVVVKNPFLYANVMDPFITSSRHCDNDWVEEQKKNFTKWLNALLTPPEELDTKNEVDVAKVWQECTKQNVTIAPSKEKISIMYHTNKKLENLRNQARDLWKSEEIMTVLNKVSTVIETGKLSIREDKDLHLNLKLKGEVTKLILGYNPLWLRIGLETIYQEIIPLRSNSDSHGLTSFVLERFFKNPHLMKKYKTTYSTKYSADIKKFMLKKFLFLVYFLDQAKTRKLIPHDPCLFCKNAIAKESKLVLINFAREILAAVGDITKYLRLIGYKVTHVQTYIHEFDYAVTNLGVDLRDGVRLARVLEIIQMRDDLVDKLRVPAISRLQKIHNLQLVFNCLEQSGYKILYDIHPKDILDGCKEKTLSFLWQIIYKFEAPLMVNKATKIQTWFRSLPVALKRLQLKRNREKRKKAAQKIENWYRNMKMHQIYRSLAIFVSDYVVERKRQLAAIKIQAFCRMIKCRKRFLYIRTLLVQFQAHSRGRLVRKNYKKRINGAVIIQKTFRGFLARKKYMQLKKATILIQRKFKASMYMKMQLEAYQNLRKSAIIIQRRYRANQLMKIARIQYLKTVQATIKIQFTLKMLKIRNYYIELKRVTIFVQRRFRANKQMKFALEAYQNLRKSTIMVQRRFRATQLMKIARIQYFKTVQAIIKIQSTMKMVKTRNYYIELKRVTIFVQRRFRANKQMKFALEAYQNLRKSTIMVQRWFRAIQLMKIARIQYFKTVQAIIKIQSTMKMVKTRNYYIELKRVTIFVQRRFRANKQMKFALEAYQNLRKSTIKIQRRYRAIQLMKTVRIQYFKTVQAIIKMQSTLKMVKTRNYYIELKRVTIFVQRRFRANNQMKFALEAYQNLRKSTIMVQRRFRAIQLMKIARIQYFKTVQAIIKIQSTMKMVKTRNYYIELKRVTIFVQRRFRANKQMKFALETYQNLRKSTIMVQRRFRAIQLMKIARIQYFKTVQAIIKIQSTMKMVKTRNYYIELKRVTIFVQRRFRANKQMKFALEAYQNLRKSTIKMQRRYRANQLTRITRNQYLQLIHATIVIQSTWKMTITRKRYLELKQITIFVQTRYRAQKLMRYHRDSYCKLKRAALTIKTYYRNLLLARRDKKTFDELRKATIFVQRKFRANKAAKVSQNKYIQLKTATLIIQRRYRAHKSMQIAKTSFMELKMATLVIQSRWRAQKLMLTTREEFVKLQQAAIVIQTRYRAVILMKSEKKNFLSLKLACIVIQARYRALVAMRMEKIQFEKLKNATILVQRRFKANRKARLCRMEFLKKKAAAQVLQTRFRSALLTKHHMMQYSKLKWAVLVIQKWYKAERAMREEMQKFIRLKKATIIIQRRFRAHILSREQQKLFSKFKKSAIVIQRYYRDYLKTKMLRERYLKIRTTLIHLNPIIRGYLARKKYIPMLTPEAVHARRVARLKNAAANKIQAFWRGFLVRNSNNPKIRNLRMKLRNKSNNPFYPTKTLTQRCDAAMTCIVTQHASMKAIIKALEDLEFITRHSSELCIHLSRILPMQLYIMIKAAGRSMPEMHLSNNGVLVLINFYKYSITRKESWNADQMDGMFDVLLHWCDKQTPLFCTLCTLIWLFAHEAKWKKVLLRLPNVEQRLFKMHSLIMRKQNMVLKSNQLCSQSWFGPLVNLKLPSRTAKWGLDYDIPVTFVNAVHGIGQLMKILDKHP